MANAHLRMPNQHKGLVVPDMEFSAITIELSGFDVEGNSFSLCHIIIWPFPNLRLWAREGRRRLRTRVSDLAVVRDALAEAMPSMRVPHAAATTSTPATATFSMRPASTA